MTEPKSVYQPLQYDYVDEEGVLVSSDSDSASDVETETKTETIAPTVTAPQFGAVLGFVPTNEQRTIFETIPKSSATLVSAVPGSGKTTTLVRATDYIPKNESTRFFTFTKTVATELQAKLPRNVKASTFHSLGFGIIAKRFYGNVNVDNSKYRQILTDTLRSRNIEVKSSEYKGLLKLIEFALLTFTSPQIEALQTMNREYDIYPWKPEQWELTFSIVRSVIALGLSYTETISSEEMLFLPLYWEAQSPGRVIPRYDNVFVDEAQDLNRAQLEIALRCASNGGRLVIVGDPNQACFSFQAADYRSIPNIIERTKPTILPLSTCWRCPVSHIANAKRFVPDSLISPRPNAPEGIIRILDIDEVADIVEPKDLVISRCLFPLVDVYLHLVAEGVPAMLKSNDAIAPLITTLSLVVNSMAHWDRSRPLSAIGFDSLLSDWFEATKASLSGEGAAKRIAKYEDHIEALSMLYERKECKTIDDLFSLLEELMAPSRKTGVLLTSIHGGKGLEANRVIHVRDDLIPSKNATTPIERQEENNLAYIAWTRSKNEMILAR